MFRLHTFFLFILLSLSLTSQPVFANTQRFSQQHDVAKFISRLVRTHHFNKQKLNKLFDQVEIQPEVLEAIRAPQEAKPWYIYRDIFVDEERVQEGVTFWKRYKNTLARAEKQFGVPASIIIAIIGIETRYGEDPGEHRVIDALSTLAFKYPPRASFFKKELKEFLLLTRNMHIDPLEPMGSYAGAMGQPQFMPSSYRHYAIDFGRNGKKDLYHSTTDSIGSVANYFKRHGWKTGQPIAEPAKIVGNKFKLLKHHFENRKPRKPSLTRKTLAKYGIKPTRHLKTNRLMSFIKLQGKSKSEYWLGFHNFYVITRYNTSKLYAMATIKLSKKIKALYNKEKNNTA